MSNEVTKTGRIWLRGALTETDLAVLDSQVDLGAKPGARMAVTGLEPVTEAVNRVSSGYFPVRMVGFNKSEQGNWAVPWHQDRVIAVKTQKSVKGYGNWSRKTGQWHCEPPLSVLSKMLFVRVHLDDCDDSSGAMEIAIGSHVEGFVGSADAAAVAATYPSEICKAQRGDILVLPMLVLHRSTVAVAPTSRRTLRIDYAADDLPPPLQWDIGVT